MKQGLVSVIMPVYNASKYLKEAIDSILAQTYSDFEFIIINDGSTDNSEEIILSYTDNRIIYLKNDFNSGICITLNKGLDIAQGEFIARMDSDDIALPIRFERQVKYLKNHQDIGVLGSDVIIFGEGLTEYKFPLSHDKWQCKADLIFNSCTAHPSVMMRNEILQKHNIRYNDNYRGIEDYELWWRLSKITHLTNYNKPLLKYRTHSQQITNNQNVEYLQTIFLKQRFNDINIFPSETEFKLFENCNKNNPIHLSNDEINILQNLISKISNSYWKSNTSKSKFKNTLSSFLLKHIYNKNICNKTLNNLRKSRMISFDYFVKLKLYNLIKND